MEAKDQNTILMKDEIDFFAMIEKKLEDQGYEVLETLPPDNLSSGRANKNGFESNNGYRPASRFAY